MHIRIKFSKYISNLFNILIKNLLFHEIENIKRYKIIDIKNKVK